MYKSKFFIMTAFAVAMTSAYANSDVPYYNASNAAPTTAPGNTYGMAANAQPIPSNTVYQPNYSTPAPTYSGVPAQQTYPYNNGGNAGAYPPAGTYTANGAYPPAQTAYQTSPAGNAHVPQNGQMQQSYNGVPTNSAGQPYPVVQQTTSVEALPPEVTQAAQQQAMAQYQNQDALQRFWGMSDKQIQEMKRTVENKQAAIYQDVSPNRCTQREIVVSNAPNEPLPFLSLDTRNKANIMFVDAAGTPWPIHYVLANAAQSSTVYDDTDPEASLLFANATQDYSQGNFTVKLADNPVPIVFSFAANQRQVDCLVTVRVNRLSSKSKTERRDYSTATLDASLNSTLYGMAPAGSKPLVTNNTGASAWQTEDGDVVIRTKYTIISPMPKSRISSPDGTYVFRVQRSPTYLYNFNGKIESFRVTQ